MATQAPKAQKVEPKPKESKPQPKPAATPDFDSSQLSSQIASLEAELETAADAERIFHAVLHALGERYNDLLRGETWASLSGVEQRLWLRGETVTLDDAGHRITGIIHGIDETGALLLTTPGGSRRVVSGAVLALNTE